MGLWRQESNLRPPQGLCGALPTEVSVPCATGCFVLARSACQRCLVFFLGIVCEDRGRLDELFASETGNRLSVVVTEVQCQLAHLVVARPVAVPVARAFVDGKRDQPCRARVGADDQHLRVTIADSELAIAASAAQVFAAHRRSVFDFQFAHDNSFLTRTRRRVMTGEQMRRCCSRCSPFELRDLAVPCGIRTRCVPFGKRRSIRCDHHRPFFWLWTKVSSVKKRMAGEQTVADLRRLRPLDDLSSRPRQDSNLRLPLNRRSNRALRHRPNYSANDVPVEKLRRGISEKSAGF